MEKQWCYKCKSLKMMKVESELITKKINREFELVCPDCENRVQKYWGRKKTMAFIKELTTKD